MAGGKRRGGRRRRRKNNEKNKIFEGGEGANQVRVVLPERISLYAKLLWNDGLGEAGLGIGPSADKIGGRRRLQYRYLAGGVFTESRSSMRVPSPTRARA